MFFCCSYFQNGNSWAVTWHHSAGITFFIRQMCFLQRFTAFYFIKLNASTSSKHINVCAHFENIYLRFPIRCENSHKNSWIGNVATVPPDSSAHSRAFCLLLFCHRFCLFIPRPSSANQLPSSVSSSTPVPHFPHLPPRTAIFFVHLECFLESLIISTSILAILPLPCFPVIVSWPWAIFQTPIICLCWSGK